MILIRKIKPDNKFGKNNYYEAKEIIINNPRGPIVMYENVRGTYGSHYFYKPCSLKTFLAEKIYKKYKVVLIDGKILNHKQYLENIKSFKTSFDSGR